MHSFFDSAPSLGVYYFLLLTLYVCMSVSLSVCRKHCFFFFVSRWNQAISWPLVLHDEYHKTVFFDFWFRPLNPQNLLPKICMWVIESVCLLVCWLWFLKNDKLSCLIQIISQKLLVRFSWNLALCQMSLLTFERPVSKCTVKTAIMKIFQLQRGLQYVHHIWQSDRHWDTRSNFSTKCEWIEEEGDLHSLWVLYLLVVKKLSTALLL